MEFLGKKIVWVSDFDIAGSGYGNISVALCNQLQALGNDIKAIGLGYKGEQHHHDFSLIPCKNIKESKAMIQNLHGLWGFDVLVVSLDSPLQKVYLKDMVDKPFTYIGILPIEADPLILPWAMTLMQMDKAFIISEFGTQEAYDAGVDTAEHLVIGIDSESWRLLKDEDERLAIRKAFGIDDDAFVVLTVADNQERKNLSACMEVFADFSKDKRNSIYILVTREHNRQGWDLRDYAQKLGIQGKLIIMERGLGFKELWSVYAMSDVFLLLSKAEGLGMPLIEAMATGLAPVGTDCTGISELLGDDRGVLIPHEYSHTDCFGNQNRYWVNKKKAVDALKVLYDEQNFDASKGRKYVEGRTWEKTAQQMQDYLDTLDENNRNS